MKLRSAVAITIAFLAVIHAEHIAAVPSAMSHEMSGTVQRTDGKTITILPTGSSKPVVFTWNSKETQFLRNGTPTTVEALPIGAKVQIRCSHPIVGSAPLLYRVSWRAMAAGGNKSKSH
ncbi:MAG TPA: hypothetical protein VFU37_23660 [Pyrinomonadaceae bacterium]|nr:hypothetical protein [Pyrinomonadaceae bacterium]